MHNTRLEKLFDFLREDPEDAFTIYAIALEYLTQNEIKAKEYFNLLMEKFPDYMGTYYQAGNLFWKLGEDLEAEKVFRKGMKIAISSKDMHALAELKSVLNKLLKLDYEDD